MKVVKTRHSHCEKRFLAMLIFLLIFSSFNVFSVNVGDVSAVPVSPYIAVVPEQTINSTITVGMTYTVSLCTDYSGNDIWGWQFSLTFDPYVLHGGKNSTDTWVGTGVRTIWYATKRPVASDSERVYVNNVLMTRNLNYTIDYKSGKITFTKAPDSGAEVKAIYLGNGVVNGDLITTVKNPGANLIFIHGEFDNTAGTLSLTGASYELVPPPPTNVTYGPGILANVTFTVMGTGYSNITLGNDTQLLGINAQGEIYKIIDAATMPNHIGQGCFDNLPNVHDVAVTRLVTPSTAIPGDVVSINVTVRNEGNFTENFDLTVYANATTIGTQTPSLARGARATLTFDWNTTNAVAGNYVINATAWLTEDIDLSDNAKIGQIEVKSVHDVAIISLQIPDKIIIGSLVPINVTVRNEGNIEENVTITISYEQLVGINPPAIINTTNLLLAERPTTKIISVSWNTTGLTPDDYKINATASIALDEDPSDNTRTRIVSPAPPIHDVAVTAISATPNVLAGKQVTINVTIQNIGSFNETSVEVKVTYDTTVIDSKSVTLLIGESIDLSFTWNTTGIAADIYSIKAEAILAGDANPDNNQRYAAVVVEMPPAPPPGHIAGIVKDASTGSPIEGANVTANGYSDITNASGHFNITNVQVGTYNVTVSADGYEASSKISITVVTGQTTSLNFTLVQIPTTGHIAGIVKDASTGNPIEGAEVTANSYVVSTGVDGSYSIELPIGTYTITVSADGYEGSSKTGVIVTAGESTTVNFELTPTQAQPPNILPYVALAVVATIVILGIAVYLLRVRKPRKTA